MADKLPYEKEIYHKLNDISLPNEELAWQNMELLLDKKDNDKEIPAIWNKGCLRGLFLLGLATVLCFVIRSSHKKNTGMQPGIKRISISEKNNTSKIDTGKNNNSPGSISRGVDGIEKETQPGSINLKNSLKGEKAILYGKKEPLYFKGPGNIFKQARNRIKIPEKIKVEPNGAILTGIESPGANHYEKQNAIVPAYKTIPAEDYKTIQKDNKDSTLIKQQNAGRKGKDPAVARYYFTAGIGLQQQVPLKGQKAVPYDYYGRKSSLADYIPSVHVRFYRDKKWFINSEFRYGAPQLTKEFVYTDSSIIYANPAGAKRSLSVKKTYYHQLPLTFNYFILPNWSIGTGGQFGRFYSAVSQEDIKRTDPFSGRDTIVSSKIIRTTSKTDSLFSRFQFSILWETQYAWKKFSLGLRYSKDLVPYIRYTINGISRQPKNQSLQMFVKYQLWKSKN